MGHECIFWQSGICSTSWLLVAWVYRFVKTHQNVLFKLVHFTVCKWANKINWMDKNPARGISPQDIQEWFFSFNNVYFNYLLRIDLVRVLCWLNCCLPSGHPWSVPSYLSPIFSFNLYITRNNQGTGRIWWLMEEDMENFPPSNKPFFFFFPLKEV